MAADKSKPKPPARLHPDERSRIEAGNSVTRLMHGEAVTKPISYYSPILIQCTLPHSPPKARDWKKTNGDFTLIVSSGVNKNLEAYGVPYGSFPRLMLAHIITTVIKTGNRRVELGNHFTGFLKEVGYTGNFKGNSRAAKTVRDQMMRLIKATISVERDGEDAEGNVIGVTGGQRTITDDFALWWNEHHTEQVNLFPSWIELSEGFYNSILTAPVPLHTDILAALRKSPLTLDVYMWVSYRLFTMQKSGQEQVCLSYGSLQTQFGTGIAEENYRLFRSRLKKALGEVSKFWHGPNGEKSLLHYEFEKTGLVLYRSPLLIGKAKPSIASGDTQQILTARKFDLETKKKARLLAGNWSLDYLQEQYFQWIEAEGIGPINLRAHFLDFVKTHRQRNGENP